MAHVYRLIISKQWQCQQQPVSIPHRKICVLTLQLNLWAQENLSKMNQKRRCKGRIGAPLNLSKTSKKTIALVLKLNISRTGEPLATEVVFRGSSQKV